MILFFYFISNDTSELFPHGIFCLMAEINKQLDQYFSRFLPLVDMNPNTLHGPVEATLKGDKWTPFGVIDMCKYKKQQNPGIRYCPLRVTERVYV